MAQKRGWRSARPRKARPSGTVAAKARTDQVASKWLSAVNPRLDLQSAKRIGEEPAISEYVPGNRRHTPDSFPDRRVASNKGKKSPDKDRRKS